MNMSMQEWFCILPKVHLVGWSDCAANKNRIRSSTHREAAFAAAAAFTTIVPVIFALFWIISLIMSSISASKMNSMIADGSFAKLSVEERDFIPKIGSAASFTFWMPGVNIITSSVFAHRMRSL